MKKKLFNFNLKKKQFNYMITINDVFLAVVIIRNDVSNNNNN